MSADSFKNGLGVISLSWVHHPQKQRYGLTLWQLFFFFLFYSSRRIFWFSRQVMIIGRTYGFEGRLQTEVANFV